MKGQSAIEYLTTYGWMLLVVAIVGGAIFTTIQNSSQIQSTSGLANADVQIENFGVTSNGLEMELRSASSDQLRNVNVSLIDPESGETVYASEEKTISVADTETVALPDLGSSENSNTYNVKINYDSGSFNDLETNGTVTGRISINGSVPTGVNNNDNNNNGGSLNGPTAAFSFNTSTVHPGELFSVNASGSTDNGSITSYNWDWTNDGNTEANSITNTHSYSGTGTYTVNLTVTDDQSNKNSITNDISVISNNNPSATFLSNFSNNITTSEVFSVDASGSSDSDGSIVSYEWDWTNDGIYDATGTTNTHNYSTTGNKTIKLRVTDDDGAVNIDTAQLEVVSTTQTVEGFEDGSLAEYSGSTSSYTVNTDNAKAYHGDSYLYSSVSSSNLGIYTQNQPGADFNRGDTLKVYMYPKATDVRSEVGFFYDGTNWYVSSVEYADNELTIYKGQTGSDSSQKKVSLSSRPTNEWIEMEIKTYSANNDIDITVTDSNDNQLVSTTYSDGDYSGTGIGFRANSVSGGDQRWDYAIIE